MNGYCKIEENKLWYLKNIQHKLRQADKQAIERTLEARAQQQNMRVGKITLLPTSFVGSSKLPNVQIFRCHDSRIEIG